MPATATLTRRDRERQLRRQEMLEAAKSVFAEKGYDKATLDEVAERAEFGKGTLYNYFPGGKEEILFAIFDEVYDGIVGLIRDFFASEPQATRPTREVFRDFMAAAIAHFLDNLDVLRILVKEGQRLMFDAEAARVAYFFEQRERMVQELIPPIERAIAAGRMRPLPPHAVAHMLMGNINGYLMFACPQGDFDAPPSLTAGEAANFISTILFDGLLTQD
jgi:TetR/AcrR family transcriptional regulator, repressor of fatR-cypB operon